jgi:hypothetical protein
VIRTLSEIDLRFPLGPRYEYLASWSISGLLGSIPASRISDLVLDICGSETEDDHTSGHHMCPNLASLIPSLRTVRLRMRKICPRIFEFPSDPEHNSRLESLIVNISLREHDIRILYSGYSSHCETYRDGWDLYFEMIEAATTAIPKLPKIKVMKLISHKDLETETVSHDCITGRRAIIAEKGYRDWDNDGKADVQSRSLFEKGGLAPKWDCGFIATPAGSAVKDIC